MLAPITCKVNKLDGVTIWHPRDMPEPLFASPWDEIPDVVKRVKWRLFDAGISSVQELYNAQPKHLRALWHNVNGERVWYALHVFV